MIAPGRSSMERVVGLGVVHVKAKRRLFVTRFGRFPKLLRADFVAPLPNLLLLSPHITRLAISPSHHPLPRPRLCMCVCMLRRRWRVMAWVEICGSARRAAPRTRAPISKARPTHPSNRPTPQRPPRLRLTGTSNRLDIKLRHMVRPTSPSIGRCRPAGRSRDSIAGYRTR